MTFFEASYQRMSLFAFSCSSAANKQKSLFYILKYLVKVITFYHFRFSTSCWVWPALLHLRSSSHTCGVRCWFPHLGFWNLSQMSLAKTSNL